MTDAGRHNVDGHARANEHGDVGVPEAMEGCPNSQSPGPLGESFTEAVGGDEAAILPGANQVVLRMSSFPLLLLQGLYQRGSNLHGSPTCPALGLLEERSLGTTQAVGAAYLDGCLLQVHAVPGEG